MKIALIDVICQRKKEERRRSCPAVSVLLTNYNTPVWSKDFCFPPDASKLFFILHNTHSFTHKDTLCSLQVLTCK